MDSINDNAVSPVSREPAEWNSKDHVAYNANFAAHRPGISHNEVVQAYNDWAARGEYEEDLTLGHRLSGPIYAAENLSKHLEGKTEARILDVAAGTGYVGELLRQKGFKNIDALEPAEKMLAVAKTKGIYKNFVCETLGSQRTNIEDDTYDAVVTSGGMGEGHIPCSGLKELVRITKPGGLVCLAMREEYVRTVEEYKDRLEPFMELLETSGYWKRLQRTMVPQYSFCYDGVVFVFRVLMSGPVSQQCNPPSA